MNSLVFSVRWSEISERMMQQLFLVTISNGGTNYSLTAQALAEMTDEVVLTMGYVVGLLYAVASLLAIYNATVIYIKLQAGEGGFTKAVLMMFGAIMFLIGATIVLPAFFGYQYGSSGFSPFD
ncbi:DUF4134 family protein [Xylanibacter ruminicola]|nr:DUF4134 family protein [Xylanibacter ruminicola]